MVHDTRAGLRIDPDCRVVDFNRRAIPGLYCAGESAGGFSQHGIGRAVCQGLISGRAAVKEPG
jgi:predicted oxidoreductase